MYEHVCYVCHRIEGPKHTHSLDILVALLEQLGELALWALQDPVEAAVCRELGLERLAGCLACQLAQLAAMPV